MKIFVTYDPALPYPQAAIFGQGNGSHYFEQQDTGQVDEDEKPIMKSVRRERHSAPSGMASFEVETDDMSHGIDADFYTIAAVDTLSEKSQGDVDTINLARSAAPLRVARISFVKGVTLSKIAAMTDPVKSRPVSTSNDPTEIYKDAMETQLRASRYKGRGAANASVLSAIQVSYDYVDDLEDARDLIIADIKFAADNAIPTEADIATDQRWPG